MCNLSDLVEKEAREKALKEGHAKGRAKGRADGIEEGKITTLVGLVADKILSVDYVTSPCRRNSDLIISKETIFIGVCNQFRTRLRVRIRIKAI